MWQFFLVVLLVLGIGAPLSRAQQASLPSALTSSKLEALLLPVGKSTSPTFAGARAVPGHSDLYFGMVCIGADMDLGPDGKECGHIKSSESRFEAYVGLIETPNGGAPRLAAGPLEINPLVNWRGNQAQEASDALQESGRGNVNPDRFEASGVAPYKISADETAFAVKGRWSDMFSGGYGSYSSLYLFAVVDGSLRQVLTTPITPETIADSGPRTDRQREHRAKSDMDVLIVTQHMTNDHFDLLLRSSTGHWNQVFRWSQVSGRYQASEDYLQ